ncbi:hypothetical protein BGZ63DRAFT_393701 [Mariannaea sp. PMI_226]|nr:hypothetical protein BGZ63DRAFT_393701 [Mariannaea sp. PMI_226]
MNEQQSTQPPAATGSHGDWDEARLEEAMQQLKLLHIKVRMLRDTVPKMIDPLIQKQPSPAIMFAAFMKSVNDANANVQEFTSLMRSDATKEVFDQVEKSRQANPKGIKPWRHVDHPDWFKMDSK